MILECYSQDAYDKYTENQVSSTLKEAGGSYGGGLKPLLYQDKVGSLCARDSKGIGNQYVDENKLIVCKIGAEK